MNSKGPGIEKLWNMKVTVIPVVIMEVPVV